MTRVSISVAIVAAALLAGCGEESLPDARLQGAAARVNGAPIPIEAVRREAQSLSGLLQPLSANARSLTITPEALERAIDEELLVQQAVDAGIDKDPEVTAAIEALRRKLLARTWLERVTRASAAATPAEVDAFYRQNPALFGDRRRYTYRTLVGAVPSDLTVEFKVEVAKASSLDDVAAWLAAQGIAFDTQRNSRLAEDLPLNELQRLAALPGRGLAVMPAGERHAVLELLDAEARPLSRDEARPVIERFIAARKRAEISESRVRELRRRARIEYLRDFRVAEASAVSSTAPVVAESVAAAAPVAPERP